jgi:hypothetical protein
VEANNVVSIAIQSAVWQHSKFKGTALLLLLAIADFADDDGQAYPSVATLARKIRSKPRNTQKILRQLQDSGELEIELGCGPHGTNLYRVHSSTGVNHRTGVYSSTRGGALEGRLPLSCRTPKPSMNHQEPSCAFAVLQISRFPDFWKTYPKKRNKGDAEKSWKKQKLDSKADEIIRAVQIQKTWPDWLQDNGKFIPHPATWLNAKGWDNEDDAVNPPAAGNAPDQGIPKFKAVV